MNQIVEAVEALALQKLAQMHVAAHTEIPIILFLDGAHVGIVALVTKLVVFISKGASLLGRPLEQFQDRIGGFA